MSRGRLFEGLLWVLTAAVALSAVLAGVAPSSVESHTAPPGDYWKHTWLAGEHHDVRKYRHHNRYYQTFCKVETNSWGFLSERCGPTTGPLEPPARFGLRTVCDVSRRMGSAAGGWENGGRWWYKAAPSAEEVTGCGADSHDDVPSKKDGGTYKFDYYDHLNRGDGGSRGLCLLSEGSTVRAVWGRDSGTSAPGASPVYNSSRTPPAHENRCGVWVTVEHTHPTTAPPSTPPPPTEPPSTPVPPPSTEPPVGWSGGCRWQARVGVSSSFVLPSYDPGAGWLVSYRLVGSLPRGMVETGGRVVGAPLTAGYQTFSWLAVWGGSSRTLSCRIDIEAQATTTTAGGSSPPTTAAPAAPAPSPPGGWNGECRFTVAPGYAGWESTALELPVYDPGSQYLVSVSWRGDLPRGLRTVSMGSGSRLWNDRWVGLRGTVAARARAGVYRGWLTAQRSRVGRSRWSQVGDRLPCVIEVTAARLPALDCPSPELTVGVAAEVRFPPYSGGRVVSYHFPQKGAPAGMTVGRSSSSLRARLVMSGTPKSAGSWSGLYQVVRDGAGVSTTCRFRVSPAPTTTTTAAPVACSRSLAQGDVARLRSEVGWRSGFRRPGAGDVRPAGLPAPEGEGYWYAAAGRSGAPPDIWPVWSNDLGVVDSSGCSWQFGSVVSSARPLFVWLPSDLPVIRRSLPAAAARWDAMDSEQRELLEAADRLRLHRAGPKGVARNIVPLLRFTEII